MADPPANGAAAELGDLIERFSPTRGNILAGTILSLLLLGGGTALSVHFLRQAYLTGGRLPFYAEKGISWVAVGFCTLLGIGLIVGGVFLLRYVRWLSRHEVEMYENGFRFGQGETMEEVRWDAVASIREIVLYERPPLLKGPASLLLPKKASTSYAVTTKSGQEFGFDGNSIDQIQRFGELLRERATRADLAWETVEQHA